MDEIAKLAETIRHLDVAVYNLKVEKKRHLRYIEALEKENVELRKYKDA